LTTSTKKNDKAETKDIVIGGMDGEGTGDLQWWTSRPRLRRLLFLPLYLGNRNYRRWRNSKLNSRLTARKLAELDKRFPKSRKDLVGRDKEYELIISAVGYHLIRDPSISNVLKGAPPPKFFLLKGASGSGKSLLAEVCLRDSVEYGLDRGTNIQPIVVMGNDIFNPMYGQSVLNISYVFRKAKDIPSIIFFDEFQSIGMKIERTVYGTDREDMRVQDAFVEQINRITGSSQKTIVIAATNKFEGIREDIRRRAQILDMDLNITREMLLAVLSSELKRYGWSNVSAEAVLEVLERSVSTYRQTQLTPFDIIDACNKVRNKKIEPIRGKLLEKFSGASNKFDYKVTLEDFEMISRELRGYTEHEKSDEVMSSVLKVKPAVGYKDIGGLFGVKEKLFKTISLSLSCDLASRLNWVPPKGFLLWGEPGCGKTYLSKAIAKENEATFFYIPAAQLLINAKWVGEPEKNMKDLFGLARRNSPSIIFFDEFDVIAGKRKGDPISDRITAQILTELDGLQPLENVIVVAATNRLEMIDEAIVNRFEPYVIEIPLPRTDKERLDVLRIHIGQYASQLEPEVTPEKVLAILKRFRVVSPRVVAEIIKEANRLRSEEVAAAMEIAKLQSASSQAAQSSPAPEQQQPQPQSESPPRTIEGQKEPLLQELQKPTAAERHNEPATAGAMGSQVSSSGVNPMLPPPDDSANDFHSLYRDDLKRLYTVLGTSDMAAVSSVTPENYKIKLYHFECAAKELEGEMEKEIMDAQESMLTEKLEAGVSLGLATDQEGRRGIVLIVECSYNPNGTGKVTVTGAARSAVVGGITPVEDTSVVESATNVLQYIRGYVYEKLQVDISRYDFTYQVISPLEGVAGMGVSGPSLGLALSVAAISELAGLESIPDTVMSGKGDIKGNVGPVGGMGWRGAGKILAAIQTKKIKIRKFILPKWNADRAPDEMEILKEEEIVAFPVERQVDAWFAALSTTEDKLLEKISANLRTEIKGAELITR